LNRLAQVGPYRGGQPGLQVEQRSDDLIYFLTDPEAAVCGGGFH
jgi:hypothetical protein